MIHGFIVVRKKNGSDGPQFPIKKSTKIGRGTHCDVRIHVQSVSEQHCLILVEQGKRAHIQNLSATSQTVVNGVSIGKGVHPLNHGDTICVGEKSLKWHYARETPFFEGQKIALHKRRRSETDSGLGTQNVAVVNPLFHKRRTLGPSISVSESRSPKLSLKHGASTDSKEKTLKDDLSPKVKTPKSAVRTPAGMSRMSLGRTPKSKKSAANSPKVKTPAKISPKDKTPKAKTPVSKSPAANTPVSKLSATKTPVRKSPATMTPVQKSSARKTPVLKSPVLNTPVPKSPATTTAALKLSAVKTPLSSVKSPVKSPAGRTPRPKSSVKSPVKSPKPTTSAAKSAVKSARKSKSVVKSVKSSKGLKRKLSSSPPAVSKRLKIESPKSIDKKKMAVLMGIHGKSPRVVSSSTLSSVKVVLSAKKTPIIKAIKTPRSSTVKKTITKSSVKKNLTKSSAKQVRRPLFSEILKKKAVKMANTAAKKLTLAPKPPPKAVPKKVDEDIFSTKIPKDFKFGSTGHANSPETIFIGKKVTKTPVVTKKGRKENLLVLHQKENYNLSGIGEMFKTPAKGKSPKTPVTSSGKKTPGLSVKSKNSPSNTSSLLKMSRTFSEEETVLSASVTPKNALKSSPRNSLSLKETPVKPSSPLNNSMLSPRRSATRSSSKSSGKSTRAMSLSASVQEDKSRVKTPKSASKSARKTPSISSIKTPQSSVKSAKRAPRMSSSKKVHALLTSTPAAFGKRQSFAESAFESPSSLLTGHISAPQSPASGRKSRMDMVVPRTSYVHSPHASPGKSSLKSSPAKSPSSAHGRSLSVSFNDNIHIQLLVPGSRKSLNSTAPLRSPASPRSENNSGTATPDMTTFDFNSIKTPNVPREMFVSSIFSSGASSSSQATGSAKRKGRPPKSPQHDVTNLQGIRRLMKTPSSPPGYVDVKGVKRLMAAECKTPTYLAVEGVKKLFGDASAAAGNKLSSFAGVRELFASPSPSKRLSVNETVKATSRKSSPVAKIQAEVESKGRSSVTMQNAVRTSSPEISVAKVSPNRSNVLSSSRVSQADSEQPSSSPSPKVVSEKNVPRRGRGRKVQPAASPAGIEPAVDSPPKRRTRKASKVATPQPKSSVGTPPRPKGRPKRGAQESSPGVVEVPVRASRKAGRSAKAASPGRKKDTSPVKDESPVKAESPVKVQSTSRRATTRKTVAAKSPSPVKISPVKRTRRAAKAAAIVASPVKPKSNKRTHSPAKEVESPSKKVKKEASEKSPPKKVATRRTRKGSSPKPEASPKPQSATPGRKRKAVTFDEDAQVTPQKKGKSATAKPESPKNSRTKKAVSRKTEKSSPKKTKTASKIVSPISISPRKTRSRK